ncbi:hypothetical protein B8W95_12915 [Staphylococcus pasteuri]|nr:hypothetical protein B8W95_12915 [Staphylococcus pasteuri]
MCAVLLRSSSSDVGTPFALPSLLLEGGGTEADGDVGEWRIGPSIDAANDSKSNSGWLVGGGDNVWWW